MAVTDSPLKQLVETFIKEFAAWLLNAPVESAQPLNPELQAQRSADGFVVSDHAR